jgi:SPP1 gp7 family putative phage head morphogenesis protein
MTTMFDQFQARVDRQRKTARLFPLHQWCAVIDPSTAPECAALHGRIWRVDDPELMRVAREHFAQAVTGCRCTGMAVRSIINQRRLR